MTFVDSPKLDGGSAAPPPRLTDWIDDHRRSLLRFLYVVLLSASLVMLLWVVNQPTDLPVGGLDGCLAWEDGDPVSATMRIANQIKETDSDGCFFFTNLPPGEQTLRVSLNEGIDREQTVWIISGQAVCLDVITMPRH